MAEQVKVLTDLQLSGALSFSKNYSDFPTNPEPRTVIVKEGIPYIYSELVNGSGFFTWQPIGIKHASWLHVQGVESTVWTVNHNLNTNDFAYFVYDQNHRLMVADIVVVDLNTTQIQLMEAMKGTAVFFSLQYLNSTTLAATQQINLGNGILTANSGVLQFSGNPLAFEQGVTNAIAAESVIRQAAESVLNTKINNIISNTDPAALDSLSELVAAYQSADSDLNASIAALGTSAASNLASEVARATAAEADLYALLSTQSNIISSTSISTATDLASEVARATAAELQLQSDLTNEISRAVAAEAVLQSNIDVVSSDVASASLYANTGVTLAQAAFNQGNSTATVANTASTNATTGINNAASASLYANTGVNNAASASLYANNALSYLTANIAIQQGIQNTQNTNITTATNNAASASLYANTGINNAASASLYANNALTQVALKANTASLATVATSGAYSDLTGKPTSVSSFTNDSGYQTAANVTSAIQAVVGAAPAALDTLAEIASQLANDESAVAALTTVVSTKANTSSLSTVATSGSYNDLTNKPTSLSMTNGLVSSVSLTTSATTANQVFDTSSSTSVRVVKYIAQITSNTSYQTSEINMLHDGTNVYYTETNVMSSGAILATFDADISGGNMRLLVTPTNAVTTIKCVKTTVNI